MWLRLGMDTARWFLGFKGTSTVRVQFSKTSSSNVFRSSVVDGTGNPSLYSVKKKKKYYISHKLLLINDTELNASVMQIISMYMQLLSDIFVSMFIGWLYFLIFSTNQTPSLLFHVHHQDMYCLFVIWRKKIVLFSIKENIVHCCIRVVKVMFLMQFSTWFILPLNVLRNIILSMSTTFTDTKNE